jgi:hypothetical protein
LLNDVQASAIDWIFDQSLPLLVPGVPVFRGEQTNLVLSTFWGGFQDFYHLLPDVVEWGNLKGTVIAWVIQLDFKELYK